ncbi:MAG: hypothetical protein ACRDSL_22865 [Pseudonocardiaceae bacterium]
MRRLSYYHPHRPGPVRGHPSPLLLVLGAVVLMGAIAVVVALVAILLTLGPLLLVGGAAATIAARRRRHRRAIARQDRMVAGRATAPVARPAPLPPPPDWAAARVRFARLRSAYGQFECDPLAVLRLPALTDVTVRSTGRFVDAFAEAQALDSDTEPPPAHRARFVAAVDQAWRAWHAALEAAERIRLAGVPAAERATVQRAIKLLTMARGSDNDAERAAAYSRARAELAKLDRTGTLRLPPAAAAALDAAARGQLPSPS